MFGKAEKIFLHFDRMANYKSFPEVRLPSSEGEAILLKFYPQFPRFPRGLANSQGKSSTASPEDRIILHSGSSVEPVICIYRIGVGEIWGSDLSIVESYIQLLDEFCEDVRGTVARYGLEMGRCGFCNRVLSDERSIQVGYGPHCARSFGLSWGTFDLVSKNKPSGVKPSRALKQDIVRIIPKSINS